MGACCSKDERYGRYVGGEDDGYEVDFDEDVEAMEGDRGARVRQKGFCKFASMHTQQGKKGINQDAMTIWEDFNGEKGTIFCSVFDGHGPMGHKVACYVRDVLPSKITNLMKLTEPNYSDEEGGEDKDKDKEYRDAYDADINDDDDDSDDSQENEDNSLKPLSSWKACFTKAFSDMDEELNQSSIDCFCSGATAVSVLKQGNHLTLANLGDSRAILGTRDGKNQLMPIQLTTDLKPNLPSEAARIKRCRGRVFALDEEPDVYRVWLPDDDCPGLAMARAFGDFCLKDYGLIATPQVSHRRITDKDEFVVLATDGVWDVLSNKEVVKIVASARKQSTAAKVVVERAVRAWKYKYPTSKVDDCAVICLFLKPEFTLTRSGSAARDNEAKLRQFSFSRKVKEKSETGLVRSDSTKEGWSALEGLTRVNSLVKLPRLASVKSWGKRSSRLSKDGEEQVS